MTDVVDGLFERAQEHVRSMSDFALGQLLADYRAWLGTGPPQEVPDLLGFRDQFQLPGTADHLYPVVREEVCRRYLQENAPERLEA